MLKGNTDYQIVWQRIHELRISIFSIIIAVNRRYIWIIINCNKYVTNKLRVVQVVKLILPLRLQQQDLQVDLIFLKWLKLCCCNSVLGRQTFIKTAKALFDKNLTSAVQSSAIFWSLYTLCLQSNFYLDWKI